MAKTKYQPHFSRVDAPYMQGAYLAPCMDAKKLRSSARSARLHRDCQNVERLSKLTQLRKVECELQDDLLPILAEAPALEHVEFHLPKSDAIPSLKSLRQIRYLVLRCNRHQSSLKFLRGMDWLHSLCVSEALGVSQLNPLSTLIGLRELYLDGAMHGRHVKVRTLAPLAKLQELRFAVLLIRSNQVKRPLRHLASLKQLEYLYLDSSYKDPDELDEVIATHAQLNRIEFNGGYCWPNKRAKR